MTAVETVPAVSEEVPVKAAGLWRTAWAFPQTKVGTVLAGVVVLVALLGPWLGPVLTGYSATDFAGKPFKPDGIAGTDGLGRDVLTRFLAGGTTLLLYAVLATVLGMVLGTLLGLVAGYGGGWLDSILMRGNDVLLSFPQLVIALLAIAVIGPKGWLLVLVIGLTHAPRTARVARQATVEVRDNDYVRAAEMYAVPRGQILLREILPNITGPMMVELGLRLICSIGYIASLSFLGLGIQPPTADWGLMINENRIALVVQPWGVLLPVVAIALLAVGTNLVFDSLASAAAGRTREARS
ncbi:ABC transporter permease [Amycolatopsis sp. NBC_00345]|uniref:ABC transporter permease n=1 Tax=Amycolatopsis sp. NBC_00345 TaxID=2975955 RepID=UPI002E257948